MRASLQSAEPQGSGSLSEGITYMIHAAESVKHIIIKGISKAVSTQQSDTRALNSVRVCVSSWPLRVVQSVQPEELRHSRVCFAVCPLAMCLSAWKTIMENFGNLFPLLLNEFVPSCTYWSSSGQPLVFRLWTWDGGKMSVPRSTAVLEWPLGLHVARMIQRSSGALSPQKTGRGAAAG